jgi:hypothetical protein
LGGVGNRMGRGKEKLGMRIWGRNRRIYVVWGGIIG